MNKKKRRLKHNTNLNTSIPENNNRGRNTKKQHISRKDNTAIIDITNYTTTSNEIIDIDDSPDVATWNKEVTKNKYHSRKYSTESKDINKKDGIAKIITEIPPTTTIGLRQENNNGKNHQVDPANQKEVNKTYNSGGKLTDQGDLFKTKKKFIKSKKVDNRRSFS
jgi:hypothetical protein